MRNRMTKDRWGKTLRPLLPVDALTVLAFVAFHFLRLPGDVLSLVAARADEMGLVHHAPRLGAFTADIHGFLRHADFHPMHVEHDPRLARLSHDAVPRAPPQAFLFAAATAPP